jgi:hypothetical protein
MDIELSLPRGVMLRHVHGPTTSHVWLSLVTSDRLRPMVQWVGR